VAAPALIARIPELEAPVAPEALPAKLLLHYEGYDAGWRDWQAWFAAQGATRRDLLEQAALRRERNYSVLIAMALAGEGIALGAVGLIREHLASGDLRLLSPPLGRAGWGYWLLSSDGEIEPEAAAARDWLIAEAAAM
jgi:DNA-binding transcriptional LysR family regulator